MDPFDASGEDQGVVSRKRPSQSGGRLLARIQGEDGNNAEDHYEHGRSRAGPRSLTPYLVDRHPITPN